MPVRENQPTLYQDLVDAFSPLETEGGNGPRVAPWQVWEWRERGATLTMRVDATPKWCHGQWERRELWALSGPELNGYTGSPGTVGKAWPHLQQVCRVERRRTVKGKIEMAISYAVTSPPPNRCRGGTFIAGPSGNAGTSKNRVHWVQDVTFDEDRSQIRTASAPG